MLVFERAGQTITHTTFDRLFEFIPSDTAVVLNDTKVIKARVFGKKESGGAVEILLNAPLQNNLYSVYIKGRVKVGSLLFFDENLHAEVVELKEEGLRVVAFFHEEKAVDTQELFAILERIGHIPLPPYIKRSDTHEDRIDYQSVFAKEKGAVAAPTASLHFSDTMFETLTQRYETHFLTLHVGAGTFKPVEAEHIQDHVMHSEIYAIPEATCRLIDSPKPL